MHEHGESCYAAERGALICGREEDEDHEHTDECYERVPILTWWAGGVRRSRA